MTMMADYAIDGDVIDVLLQMRRDKSPKSFIVMACKRFFFFCLILHLDV